MSDIALPGSIEPARKGPDLSGAINPVTGIIFGGIVAAVLLFVAYSIYSDMDETGTRVSNYLPFLLLFVALLIALGFEFVNGFHDTANAVATVIYTRSLPANFAVVWSGLWNLAGVLEYQNLVMKEKDVTFSDGSTTKLKPGGSGVLIGVQYGF